MTMPILFFAAGLGTRMGELTKDRPKPLIPVAGRPLIEHAFDFSEIPEVGRRIVNLHYHGDMIRQHLRDRTVTFSDESTELLETGGGLKKALPLLQDNPVLTMNTDAVWSGPNPIRQILGAWQNHMEALLLLVPQDRAVGHLGKGDFTITPDGRLQRGPGAIYTGLQIINTDCLADIQEHKFSMNLAWDQIATRRGLYGCVYEGQWCDVGQPASIPMAETMLHV